MAMINYADKVALNTNSNIADINKCNATDMNLIKNVVNGLIFMFGLDKNPFSETKTYEVNDFVTKDYILYKCHTAVTTAGAWTGTENWNEASLLVLESENE